MSTVHVLVPDGIDDPARPSGGNAYDRRVCTELSAAGWSVVEHAAPGSWPDPRRADVHALATLLDTLDDGSVVLADGLVASAAADVVGRHAARLHVVPLVHLPLGVVAPSRRQPERALLSQVAAVVVTSGWTRTWLVEHYRLDPRRVRVAVPGADLAEPADRTLTGGALLCVGAVTPTKGQDLLVDALARIDDLAWRCACVGSLDVEPGFVRTVRDQVDRAGLGDRVRLDGPLVGAALDAAYRAADVLVLPSRAETYGMVATEALARGVPVIATATGGTAEALGRARDGTVPGLLLPTTDADALAGALRTWLGDPGLRTRLRAAAADRRGTLPAWSDTAARIAEALACG